MLTGGQVADCTAGEALLERLPHCDILHADKGYDANAIRQQVERRGTMPNIPPKANRKWKNCFSPFLYRNRNAFSGLPSLKRMPTRFTEGKASFVNSNNFKIIFRPATLVTPVMLPPGSA